jgi:phage tail-like protein
MVVAIRETILERTPTAARSSYLEFLPAIYSDDPFLGRFLMIFESIMGPLEVVVDNLKYYFGPGTTPEELLPWLASWLDLVLDENWPLGRRRDLVKSAVELYQWRGTCHGLSEYLRVYTGTEPRIIEDFGGIPLTGEARLGRDTVLGGGSPNTFSVILELDGPDAVDENKVRAIIDAEKPAHTTYNLELIWTATRT